MILAILIGLAVAGLVAALVGAALWFLCDCDPDDTTGDDYG